MTGEIKEGEELRIFETFTDWYIQKTKENWAE